MESQPHKAPRKQQEQDRFYLKAEIISTFHRDIDGRAVSQAGLSI